MNRTPISIVVPVRNEAAVIGKTLLSIDKAIAASNGRFAPPDIVVVDDSDDDLTFRAATTAAGDAGLALRLIHRLTEDRDGLSGAIRCGLQAARNDVAVVMDGDGQHPVATVLEIAELLSLGHDIVLGTRYLRANGDAGLSNGFRRLGTRTVRSLLRLGNPSARKCTDPLSGLFGIRRTSVVLPAPARDGWKYAFSILTANPQARYGEAAYTMDVRLHGESKLKTQTVFSILKEVGRASFIPSHSARSETYRSMRSVRSYVPIRLKTTAGRKSVHRLDSRDA